MKIVSGWRLSVEPVIWTWLILIRSKSFCLLWSPNNCYPSLKRVSKHPVIHSKYLIPVSITTEYFYAFLISPFIPFHERLLDFILIIIIIIIIIIFSQFALTFSYFLSLRPPYSPQHTVLKHPQPNLCGSQPVVFIYPQTIFVRQDQTYVLCKNVVNCILTHVMVNVVLPSWVQCGI
jgi:hypothetical protein